ncbi:hypothetical protein NSA19_10365 [Actinomyces bowdenii]|nr:hypothetical protein [Actinomyces bowdenii]MCR2053231.1 hypothetical protein [Actinomyces bowdenii]
METSRHQRRSILRVLCTSLALARPLWAPGRPVVPRPGRLR